MNYSICQANKMRWNLSTFAFQKFPLVSSKCKNFPTVVYSTTPWGLLKLVSLGTFHNNEETVEKNTLSNLFIFLSHSFSPLETYLNFPRTPTGLFEYVSFWNLEIFWISSQIDTEPDSFLEIINKKYLSQSSGIL